MTEDDRLGLQLEAEGTWREAGWRLQILRNAVQQLLGMVAAGLNFQTLAMSLVFLLGVFMLGWPILIFYLYLSSGILLLSPPLVLMFLAGFVALGLARSRNWETVDRSRNPRSHQ